jgi:hypothetical protein
LKVLRRRGTILYRKKDDIKNVNSPRQNLIDFSHK